MKTDPQWLFYAKNPDGGYVKEAAFLPLAVKHLFAQNSLLAQVFTIHYQF